MRRSFLITGALLALLASRETMAQEKWQPIFDGRTLDGWTPKVTGHPSGDNFADTFSVRDGAIRVSYERYGPFNYQFGHLFYKVPFKAFRLRLKYRILAEAAKDAPPWGRSNSGVMFASQSPQSMALDQWYPASVEFQILGRNENDPKPTGSVCTPGTNVTIKGEKLKTHCATSSGPIVPNGTWVDLELDVLPDGQVAHIINGVEVLRYDHVELNLLDLTSEPLIGAQKGNRTPMGGYIALQSEGHSIEFKDIALQEIR